RPQKVWTRGSGGRTPASGRHRMYPWSVMRRPGKHGRALCSRHRASMRRSSCITPKPGRNRNPAKMSQASSWSTECCRPSSCSSSASQRARSKAPFQPLLGEPRIRSRLLKIVPARPLLVCFGSRSGEYNTDLLACRFQCLYRGVWLDRDDAFPGPSGHARAAFVLQAQVEFQWPGLLIRGVGADTGDLEEAQRVHPRDQTDGDGRSGFGRIDHPDDCLERREGVEFAFAPSEDISGPAPAMEAGIGLETHQLIGAHFEREIIDLKQLPRCCTARQDTHERDMRRLSSRRLYALHFQKHRAGRPRFDVPLSVMEKSTESRGPACYGQGRLLVF